MGSRALSALNLADKSTNFTAGINIDKLFEQALKEIYAEYGLTPPLGGWGAVSKPLFDITNKSLQQGIDKSFSVEFGKSDPEFINQFKTNAAVFAAFKTHAQGNEIAKQLLDADGNLKSYYDFKKSVLGTSIKADYNQNWLKTEYNMAVRSARMAEKWKGFERVKHLYPNLEFIESTAVNKRPEHLQWVGTILPIEHPWWNTHTPPVGWGCECDIRNTDKDVTTAPGYEEEVPSVFANNPGKTAEFINIKEHPMVKGVCKNFGNCKTRLNLADKPLKPECGICEFVMAQQRSESALLREQTLKQMEVLLSKSILKEIKVKNEVSTINVRFTKEGNKHLYSDTFVRAKGVLQKEDLKSLDKILEKATFVKPADLSKDRKDHIKRFYYYEAEINGKKCYLNVAEKVILSKGRERKLRFLYSITKWLK